VVTELERVFEAACRLDQCEAQAREDAHRRQSRDRRGVAPYVADQLAERFERRLVWVEAALDRELDRLTAERLVWDLTEKQRRTR
jgi:hypothetical protein